MKRFRKFFYINNKTGASQDETWKEQAEQTKANEVYSIVNFEGGGTLIDEYDKGGINESEEVKKKRVLDYMENVLKPKYLYVEDNKVIETNLTVEMAKKYTSLRQKISEEFRKRKERHEAVIQLEVENIQFGSMVSLDSIIPPYEAHKGTWNLYKRGAVGETPLHLLFLNNTPKHLRIASYILEVYPELALDLYEGPDYFGESCLHFSIIQNDLKSVKMLLNTGKVDLCARAKGRFFMPTDVKRGTVKLKNHKYSGYAYYGELPLSFAASIGNIEIYDELIKHGADINLKDRFGNTLLHLAVVYNQANMYHHAISHNENSANKLQQEPNNEGLTPISLAAKLGRIEMLQRILDMNSKQFWTFSNMSCIAYPLLSLDTIKENGDTDWNSALMKIIEGKSNNHLDMLEIGAIDRLINEKWKTFARTKFIRLFIFHIIHLVVLSCAVYLRPTFRPQLMGSTDSYSIARYVFEIVSLLICLMPVFFGGMEIWLETFSGFWRNIRSIPSRFLYYLGCILLLLCIPFRLLRLYNVEEWLLVFAIPFIWSYLLFFARGWHVTGPFVTMIYRMIVTDIARFAFIYAVLLVTSAVAFYYQFEGQNVNAFLTEVGTFMTLFQMSLGEFDYEAIKQGKYPALSRILFVVYMLLVHVLLLNMLIAMMTGTYEEVAERTLKEWRRQWASMTIVLERSHRNQQKLDIQETYSANIQAQRMTESGDPAANEDESEEAPKVSFENRAILLIQDSGISVNRKKQDIKKNWRKLGKEALKLPKEDDEPEQRTTIKNIDIQGKTGMAAWMSGIVTKDVKHYNSPSTLRRAFKRPTSPLAKKTA